MKIVIILLGIFLLPGVMCAQKRSMEYKTSLTGFISSENELPFWMISNRHGLIPNGKGGLLEAGIFSDFNHKHKIQFAYGFSGAAYLSQAENNLLIDQLYVSAKWKKFRLDLGMIHPEEEYNGTSSTNGNFVRSGNSRTMPGYNLSSDYISVGDFFAFKFNWADYQMIDDRYVKDTRLHNKSLFVKFTIHRRIELIMGLEHWAQWGGKSPVYGKQPSSFKDYLRIVAAKEGGSDASQSDMINALGNHLGREHLRINYIGDNYTLTFYHDIPFEDGSGTDFRSFPDGTYNFYYGAKNKEQWISDITYEFYYTKYQSGSRHDRPATPEEMEHQDPNSPTYGKKILGGCDDYFNNGEYRSGWTLYQRTIGSPFMLSDMAKGGLGIYNNRIIAHYIGIKGKAFREVPYKAMLSYSINYGTYSKKIEGSHRQFSFGLEARLPLRHLPVNIDTGIYGDFGKVFKNNIGLTVKISRKGFIK
ncbi:capsule assembly Wzi family protein [Sanguibacteroides justesenii]|uniref:capsule assembly Wzi family protein n=1 Tax=Sanguibacteroides justesenii TaxID=1547597 RepID=UPI001F32847C|nr:capsule assembly Wzi family protein [Sanguibacteroides justesenii]